MQKLTKDFVKKLIYEAIKYNQTTKELQVLDDEGAVIDRREDYPESQLKVDYPEETASLTKESLDRIIREEVEAHYRNRK